MTTGNGNPRGVFTLTFGGEVYSFKMGSAATRMWQEHHAGANGDAPELEELWRQVRRQRAAYLCSFLWAAIQYSRPGFTLAQVDEMLDQADPLEVATLLHGLGVTMRPDPADAAQLVGDRPPEAGGTPAGTNGPARRRGGARSTGPAAARG